MKRILRAAPDEEIAVSVSYIVHISAYGHVFAFRHRYMVGHVAAQTHTVVEALLTITLIFESADSSRYVKITDTTGVRSLCSVIKRKARTRVFIVLVVVVNTYITAHFRLRLQTRTLCTNVDHTVQRRRTVQHRRSTFDHLYLRYVLQRHVVPVDLTGLGVQDRHLVHQHLTTATNAVRPTSTATDTRLLVDDLHTRQGLQGSRQVGRSLTTQHLRLDHLHRDRYVRLTLLKTTGGNHHLVQFLVMRKQRNIQFRQHGRHKVRLCVITHIRKTKLNSFFRVQRNRIPTVYVRHGTYGRIVNVVNSYTDQRLTRLEIGYNTRYFGHCGCFLLCKQWAQKRHKQNSDCLSKIILHFSLLYV